MKKIFSDLHLKLGDAPSYICLDRGEKFNVYSGDTKYLDLQTTNSLILGHCNKRIVEAISKQLMTVSRAQIGLGYTTELIEEVSDFVCKTGNWRGLSWATSGTGAVEAAICANDSYWKIKKKYKPYIISFKNMWHGTTHLMKSMAFPEMTSFPSERAITMWAPGWEEIEDRERHEGYVIETILEEIKKRKGEVGCIVFDPCPWFNGIKPYSEFWWTEIKKICEEHDLLMITDDVCSGWGKHGCWHSHEKLGGGVKANISALGKALTAGYTPLSATVVDEKVYDVIKNNFAYGNTQKPDVIGIAAMKETINIIQEEKLFENISWFEKKVEEISKKAQCVKKVRSHGCFVSFDFYRTYEVEELLGYGLSNRNSATKTLKFCIPLNADEDYFEQLEKILLNIKNK